MNIDKVKELLKTPNELSTEKKLEIFTFMLHNYSSTIAEKVEDHILSYLYSTKVNPVIKSSRCLQILDAYIGITKSTQITSIKELINKGVI